MTLVTFTFQETNWTFFLSFKDLTVIKAIYVKTQIDKYR